MKILFDPITGQIRKSDEGVINQSDLNIAVSSAISSSNNLVRSVNSAKGDVTLTKSSISLANVDNTSDANKPVSTAQKTYIDNADNALGLLINACVQQSKVGVSSGIAELDALGTLKSSQIPSSLLSGLKWKGVWNASTNSPALTTTPSSNGDFYKISIGGTSSAPTGSSVTYVAGDWLISNGTVWQYIQNTLNDATSSVKGVVQLTGDLGGGAASPLISKINGITVPVSAPSASRKFMMSSSTSALQYDSILITDLPDSSLSSKGILQLAGDLGGTAALPSVLKLNGWTIGSDPTAINQVLAVTDFGNKVLGYVAQTGGSGTGISSSYMRATGSSNQLVKAGYIVALSPSTTVGSDITCVSNCFLLKANKTYRLRGSLGGANFTTTTNSWLLAQWRVGQTGGSGTLLGVPASLDASANSSTKQHACYVAEAEFAPISDTWVHLDITSIGTDAYIGDGNVASAWIEVISGAAPVTGQSVDYLEAVATGSGMVSVTNGSYVQYTLSSGNLSLNSGVVTLYAGKTYELKAQVLGNNGIDSSYSFYNITNSTNFGSVAICIMATSSSPSASGGIASAIITPTVNTHIALKNISGVTASIWAPSTFISIKQLGTSSVINMVGANQTTDGIGGTIPSPSAGYQNRSLFGDAAFKPVCTPYDSTVNYNTGDMIMLNGNSYVFNGILSAGAGLLYGITGSTVKPVLGPSLTWKGVWASGSTYAVGDIISISVSLYSSLYRCVYAHTATTQPGTIGTDASSWVIIMPNQGSVMTGAGKTTAGVPGLVPVPAAGKDDGYLKGNGTWDEMTWISFTPTITATTTNPTLGTGYTFKCHYRIIGKTLSIRFLYIAGTGYGQGSGSYKINISSIPVTVDTAQLLIDSSGYGDSQLGIGWITNGTNAYNGMCKIDAVSATELGVWVLQGWNTGGGAGFWSGTVHGMGVKLSFQAEIPII